MQAAPGVGEKVNLRQLLAEAEFFGGETLTVCGVSADSRRVRPGEAFVALPGTQHDGHQFVADAIGRGAAAIVASQPVPFAGVPVCIVPDTADAYGRLCQALAGYPSRQMKVVGITGTNGKTSATWLVASILATAGRRVGMLGTLGYFDGENWGDAALTTPPADEIATWMARMVAHECQYAVMEVSSHALAQSRVSGINFDAACVTNVRRDHLDYHRTLSGYRLAKSKLFRHLAPEGFAVINADDPTAAGYLHQLDGPVLTVGIHSAAEITAVVLERYQSEQTFLLVAGSEAIPVRTQMIGTHHIYNCLVAAAVGLAYQVDLPTIARGLEAVKMIPGRLQRIECGQPFGVFVDFAHTPDALAATLQTLREVCSGRLICVFGAGGDRDKDKRPLMGQEVEAAADVAIVTSDNPRDEAPEAILEDILRGFTRPEAAHSVLDRSAAIQAALSLAQPGDCVMIAGKGHETYQLIGGERLAFDDAEVATTRLYQMAVDGAFDAPGDRKAA